MFHKTLHFNRGTYIVYLILSACIYNAIYLYLNAVSINIKRLEKSYIAFNLQKYEFNFLYCFKFYECVNL